MLDQDSSKFDELELRRPVIVKAGKPPSPLHRCGVLVTGTNVVNPSPLAGDLGQLSRAARLGARAQGEGVRDGGT